MTAPSLTPNQKDATIRAGRVAGILFVAHEAPETLVQFPDWARYCLAQIAEASAQNAQQAVSKLESPFALGFTFGSLGTIGSLVRKPEEKWGAAVPEALDILFGTYISTIKELTGAEAPPLNWVEFAQLAFSAFMGYTHPERLEYHEGLRVALEVERNFRSGDLRITTATPIYFELLLFLPEIQKMRSLGEVFRFLELRFNDTPQELGDFERFRKLANRIQLSFRDQNS